MQCTRSDLKSPLRKNMVFFSSLITVIQRISLQFAYSDKKPLMANLAFPGTHLVDPFYLALACPESQYIHCSGGRLPGSALPRKGKGPPGAAKEGLAQPCYESIVIFFFSSLLQFIVPQWFGAEV